MKKIFRGLMEVKTSACQLFTAAMTIYLCFSLVFNNCEVSTAILWGLLLMSAAGSFLQTLCFSNWMIKKMRYTWRSVLFVLLFFPVLALTAWKAEWFPVLALTAWKAEWFPIDKAGAWAMFTGIFFLIFLAMTIGFEIYFRITGRKYDGLIGQYRQKKEEEDDNH